MSWCSPGWLHSQTLLTLLQLRVCEGVGGGKQHSSSRNNYAFIAFLAFIIHDKPSLVLLSTPCNEMTLKEPIFFVEAGRSVFS